MSYSCENVIYSCEKAVICKVRSSLVHMFDSPEATKLPPLKFNSKNPWNMGVFFQTTWVWKVTKLQGRTVMLNFRGVQCMLVVQRGSQTPTCSSWCFFHQPIWKNICELRQNGWKKSSPNFRGWKMPKNMWAATKTQFFLSLTKPPVSSSRTPYGSMLGSGTRPGLKPWRSMVLETEVFFSTCRWMHGPWLKQGTTKNWRYNWEILGDYMFILYIYIYWYWEIWHKWLTSRIETYMNHAFGKTFGIFSQIWLFKGSVCKQPCRFWSLQSGASDGFVGWYFFLWLNWFFTNPLWKK